MDKLDFELRRSKDLLFNSFDQENFKLLEITETIGQLNANREKEIYSFFKKVRGLCNENQKVKFDEIISKALKGGMPQKPPMRGSGHFPKDRGMPPPPR